MIETMIALVTGANKGIGREIARALAAHGATVVLGARDPKRGKDAADELRDDGGDVYPIHIDVTDEITIRAAAREIDERHGRLDVLVNNAGIPGDVAKQQPGQARLTTVRLVMETNLLGVAAVTEAMLPLLLRSPRARIVNVSSSIGSFAKMTDPSHQFAQMPASVAYPVSKAALNMLTVQYAKGLRDVGVEVNAADPGACATDFTKPLGLPLTRTPAQGAAIAAELATAGHNGATGGLFADNGPVQW